MSLYSELETIMKDEKALLAALADVGFTRERVEVHAAPETLYGYRGDARPEKAEVIIRRKFVGRLANDIGFARQADGSYRAIISEYDLHKYGTAWLDKLMERYSVHATLQWAERKRFHIKTQDLESGDVQIVMEWY